MVKQARTEARAVESAFEPLKIAKEKGGSEYTSVNKTLAFLASQIGIEED